jgi:hypothetical protein
VGNSSLIQFFKGQLENNYLSRFYSETNTYDLSFLKNKNLLLKFSFIKQLQTNVPSVDSFPSITDVTDKTFEEISFEVKIKNIKPEKTFLFLKYRTPLQFNAPLRYSMLSKSQYINLKETLISPIIETTSIPFTSLKNFLSFFYFSHPSALTSTLSQCH